MARMAMKKLAEQVPTLQIVKECSNAIEAFHELSDHEIDLLLLDIEMPGMTGLELTKNLGKNSPLIIFTTANKDYAVEAFELNVVDYLIKPVSAARFLKAIKRAQEILDVNKNSDVTTKEFMFIKDNGILTKLKINDILYLEAMGDYVRVHTEHKFHLLHTTLKSIEDKLPSTKFIRVHRSYIVALSKIDYIQNGMVIINNVSVPMADTYKTNVTKRLNLL